MDNKPRKLLIKTPFIKRKVTVEFVGLDINDELPHGIASPGSTIAKETNSPRSIARLLNKFET